MSIATATPASSRPRPGSRRSGSRPLRITSKAGPSGTMRKYQRHGQVAAAAAAGCPRPPLAVAGAWVDRLVMVGRVIDLDQGWRTERLDLEPLVPEHAAELGSWLDDLRLHEFTGGEPLSTASVAARDARLEHRRSGDGSQVWGNWLVRVRSSGRAAGTVQATLPGRRPRCRSRRGGLGDGTPSPGPGLCQGSRAPSRGPAARIRMARRGSHPSPSPGLAARSPGRGTVPVQRNPATAKSAGPAGRSSRTRITT